MHNAIASLSCSHFDSCYFTRGNFDVYAEIEDFQGDEIFSTSHDYKISKVIANEWYQDYLMLKCKEINQDCTQLRNIFFALPPLSEQVQIVRFLDEKISQIDSLISKKKKLISLLKEERTALIKKAITKGIDPYVQYKESGIEWIGEIPANWELTKLKFLGNAFGGLTYSPADVVESEGDGKLVLRSSNIQDGKLSLKDSVSVKCPISEKLLLRRGDILICSRNGSKHLIGKNICIDKKMEGNTFGAFMMVFRSQHWKFLKHFFNSPIFISQSGLFITATINQLTSNTVNNFWIALPKSGTEQASIAIYLDQKTSEIDTIITKTEKEIALIKEYKNALINDVVSGKIDVRDSVVHNQVKLQEAHQ